MIIFDDTLTNMLSNKKVNPIVRVRKLNICLVFITQSYFLVPNVVRLNCTHYIIMNLPNKQELKQIASKNSSDIDFQDFINLYKKCTANHILF